MGWEWEPWPAFHRKGNNILPKLLVSVLLMGLSFRLFLSSYKAFWPVSETSASAQGAEARVGVGDGMANKDHPLVDKTGTSNFTISKVPSDVDLQDYQTECDLFSGEWIPNPSGPAYTNESCSFIEPPQDCLKNGRPDKAYLYWRWKPHSCDVAPFDAGKFFDAMRDKSWALIGDSILRNHVQSLICLLSKVEKAVEVYHDKEYKSRRWIFPVHNFTLSLIWSPFLVKADIFENDNGVSNSEIELHLDILDEKWISQYHNFDYIVISGGQWFLKTAIYWENKRIIGCHYCPGKNLTEVGLELPYRKVLESLFRFCTASEHKPRVVYRTWTPDHFENGEWFSGGTCNRTVPYKKGEFSGRDVDRLMRGIELDVFNKAVVSASSNGAHLKLLDTYSLSVMRPDGHSGPYRTFHPFDKDKSASVQNDCLHWCLPGAIDTWNDLLMKLVLNE